MKKYKYALEDEDEELVCDLFKKKFVYSRKSHWSLSKAHSFKFFFNGSLQGDSEEHPSPSGTFCHELNGNNLDTVGRDVPSEENNGVFTLSSSWQCCDLLPAKEELNNCKNKLNDKDLTAWGKHTKGTNLAAKVVEKIKRVYGAELCTIAWCKFHEILATGEVLPADLFSHQRPFYSVHLCEGPGSFITSLNHYLATRGLFPFDVG